MSEPDVALTDYLLTLECTLFAVLMARRPAGRVQIRFWFIVFFAATAVASWAGGTVHGFFPAADSQGHRILWPLSLLAIGLASLAGWCAGARAIFSAPAARVSIGLALCGFAAYALAVLTLTEEFWIALAAYLPAGVILLTAFLRDALRRRSRTLALASAGVVTTFVAGGVQQLRYSIHPVYLTHNAVYHLILAGALILIFLGARRLAALPPVPERS